MSLFTVLLIAGGVSADAFAVALGKGLSLRRPHPRTALSLALAFGLAQAVMFLLGWLLGFELETYVTAVDHWIAFALLLVVGGAMLSEARSSDDDEAAAEPVLGSGVAVRSRVAPRELLVLAVATSIDALAVGISIALLDVDIVVAVVAIGLVTFLLSLGGFALGQRAGARFRGFAEVAGGLVLIAIGTRILLEHLGVL
jgi:putative Mn2+ efflux pump MntP